jgi:membrane associated rhomboid family serine protease
MNVTIVFRPHVDAASDAPVEMSVDDVMLFRGAFGAGFCIHVELTPGPHVVSTRIKAAFYEGKRQWTIMVPADTDAPHVLQIRHTLMSGNFDETVDFRAGTLVELAPVAEAEPEPELPSYPVRATWVILALLALVLGLELLFPISPAAGASPSIATLNAFGGLGATAWHDREWYRFLACTWLHADPVHLAFNGFSLALGGAIVERKLGAARFLFLYLASGLGGSVASLAANKGNIISVGASGAVLGLFAAGMVLASAYPKAHRNMYRVQLGRVLVPSLLPLFQMRGGNVDYGAHFGGAIMGAWLGYVLLKVLRSTSEREPPRWFRTLGNGLAGTGVLATVLALILVYTSSYPTARAEAAVVAELIPNEELNAGAGPTDAQYTLWQTKYPRDPRVLLWVAGEALDHADPDGFERALRETDAAITRTAPAFDSATQSGFRARIRELEGSRAKLILAPNSTLPQGTPEEVSTLWASQLAGLIAKYPNDPRLLYREAFRVYDTGDDALAVAHARAAHKHMLDVQKFFDKPIALTGLYLVEALSLRRLGRDDEAKAAEAHVCSGDDGEKAQQAVKLDGRCAK